MENTYTPNYTENILDDVDYSLYQASAGKRFVNMIIDWVAYYILCFCFGMVLGIVAPEAIQHIDDTAGSVILFYLFLFLIDVMYFTVLETYAKGKTLGKLLTGTRVVNHDGTGITFKTAFLRSLSRLVPFEPFSAFGDPSNPWHDSWTNTYVIDDKQSKLPGK